jgi:cytoskeleton protein RodZ
MPASWVSQLQGLVSESGLATSTPIAGAASVAEMAASEPESAMPPSTMAAPESEALPIAAASAASQALPAQDSSSASVAAAASAAASAAVSAGNLQIRARQDSWIEVMDAQSQPLISRLVRSGELVNLDGVAPLRLKVGNALGTDVSFRGNAIDLKATARDNVARVELK